MRLSRMHLGFSVLLWSTVLGLAGETVYVDPAGNDANPGTMEKPLRSLYAVGRRIVENPQLTELIFKAGRYEEAQLQIMAPTNVPPGSLPVLTLRAADNAEVIFSGSSAITTAEPVDKVQGVFQVPGKFSYGVPPQLWEEDTRRRYIAVADIQTVRITPASYFYSESNCIFHTSDGLPPEKHRVGISLDLNAALFIARPNTIIDGLAFHGYLMRPYSAAVDIRGTNVIIRNCRAWNCCNGFSPSVSATNCVIEKCRTDDCADGIFDLGTQTHVLDSQFIKVRDGFMIPVYPQNDTGIQSYFPAREGVIRGNLVKGFDNGIFIKTFPESNFTVEYNTLLNGKWGIYRTAWESGNVFLRNIIAGFQTPLAVVPYVKPGCIVDYNCIWDARDRKFLEDSLRIPPQSGTGGHNFVMDPRFASPGTDDYRLLPDSPCLVMAGTNRPFGALGPVPGDFKDQQPPSVALTLDAPAVPAGDFGELFFENDPWNGGGRTQVRNLHRPDSAADYLVGVTNLGIIVDAHDAFSRPAKMRWRVGDTDWSAEEAFAPRRTIDLPAQDGLYAVSVKIADNANNWSQPATVRVRFSRKAPELTGTPYVYANDHGVIISFQSSVPALAAVEYGTDNTYGTRQNVLPYINRRWASADGGDWVAEWNLPRRQHHVALVEPSVKSGGKYHFRIVLKDAAGNESVGPDNVFKVSGQSGIRHVAVNGRDEDGGGTQDKPWGTLQFAVDRALPGDRIVVAPGLYVGETYIDHGGIENAPLTLEAGKAGAVILDGVRGVKAVVRLEHASYVVIKGMEIRWYDGGDGAGIYLVDSSNCVIQDCAIWNDYRAGWSQGAGIFAHRSPGLAIERNLLMWQEYGVFLLQSPRAKIISNTACGHMYAGLEIIFSAANTVVRNNSLAFNGNDQMVMDIWSHADLQTFDCDYNNYGAALRETAGPGRDTVISKSQALYPLSKRIIACSYGKKENNFVTMKAWREFSGKDQHSIFADPLYVNPAGRDFRLQPGSPNIGSGEKKSLIGSQPAVN